MNRHQRRSHESLAKKLRRHSQAYIYTRYSDLEHQHADSLVDQERTAVRNAALAGVEVAKENIMSDAGISGIALGDDRPGWERLRSKIFAGQVKYLFASEHSRLFRDEVECAEIKREIRKWDITVIAGQVNTSYPGWTQLWTMEGMRSAMEREELIRRIKQKKEGIVLRGTLPGKTAYGYDSTIHYRDNGERDFTEILVHPEESLIVKRIFGERLAGKSLLNIAHGLIRDGIPSPSASQRKAACKYWGLAAVTAILWRPLYKGILKFGPTSSFQPHLALVSPEDWSAVQRKPRGSKEKTKGVSLTNRGGGKYWGAGLVSCTCGQTMNVTSKILRGKWTPPNMFCIKCQQGRRLGIISSRYGSSTTMHSVRLALECGMRLLLTPERVAEFKAELKATKSQSRDDILAGIDARLQKTERAIDKLSEVLEATGEEGLEAFTRKLEKLRDQKAAIKNERVEFEMKPKGATSGEIEKQLRVDLPTLIPQLFEGRLPVEELRSLLYRIFPRIIFEGLNAKESYFLITINMGGLFAGAAWQPKAVETERSFRVCVIRQPIMHGKYPKYVVDLLDPDVTNTPVLPAPSNKQAAVMIQKNKRRLMVTREAA